MSQSYTVLYVSLFAHFCQLTFLALVETPRAMFSFTSVTCTDMKKIYPEMVGDQTYNNPLATPGTFKKDLVALKNFTPFRAADVFTAIILIQFLFSHLLFLKKFPAYFFIGT